MASKLQWNRLTLERADDVACARELAAQFPKLLAVEFPVIECDLVALEHLGKATSTQLIACMAGLAQGKKSLVLRINAGQEAAIAPLRLPNEVSVDVIRHMKRPPEGTSQAKSDGDISVFTAPTTSKGKASSKRRPSPLKTALPAPELPGGGRKNRPTLVGLPRTILEDDTAQVRSGADGVEELIFDELNPGDQSDLKGLDDGELTRDIAKVPELKRAWLRDTETGEVREIGDGLTIGREEPADWRVGLPTVSKLHFRIYRQNKHYFLDDLEATNGTFLADIQVIDRHVPLMDGDRIVMAITLKHPAGARTFTFHGTKPK